MATPIINIQAVYEGSGSCRDLSRSVRELWKDNVNFSWYICGVKVAIVFMNFLKLRVAYSDLERVSYEFEGTMEQFEKYIAMVDAEL